MSCKLSGDQLEVAAEEIACDMDCTDNISVSGSASSHNFGNTEYAEDTAASTSDVRVLRINIADPASAEEWMQQYKAATNTSWIVKSNKTNCTR